jgi:hypothetical protein
LKCPGLGLGIASATVALWSGLPDFHWYNIQKWENIPNFHKIFQIGLKNTKWSLKTTSIVHYVQNLQKFTQMRDFA